MTKLLERLTPETRERLRAEHPWEQDERWVYQVARQASWTEANRRYLQAQQGRGHEEMKALLEALGIQRVDSPRQAAELIAAGYELFMPLGRFRGQVTPLTERTLLIRVEQCPTFSKFEETGWHGVTACGSWHRRRGWYEAMGVEARDGVVAEKKWGDPACAAHVELVAP